MAATALAHGLYANLLRKWITIASGRRASGRGTDAVLLPVRTGPDAVAAPVPTGGYVEIVLVAGTIRLDGRVAAETLRVELDGLSRRSWRRRSRGPLWARTSDPAGKSEFPK